MRSAYRLLGDNRSTPETGSGWRSYKSSPNKGDKRTSRCKRKLIGEIVRSQLPDLPRKKRGDITFFGLARSLPTGYRQAGAKGIEMTKLTYVLCWLCRYSLPTIIAFGVRSPTRLSVKRSQRNRPSRP